MFRGYLNGAPFGRGDRVQIFAGRHRGTVTTIYATCEHDRARVNLGEVACNKYEDVFDSTQLLRELSEGDTAGRWPGYRVAEVTARTLVFVGLIGLAVWGGIETMRGRKLMETMPASATAWSFGACLLLGLFLVFPLSAYLQRRASRGPNPDAMRADRKNAPPEGPRGLQLLKIVLTIVVCVFVAIILSVLIDQLIIKWG